MCAIWADDKHILLDNVLTDRHAKEKLLNEDVQRWTGSGLFDCYLVEAFVNETYLSKRRVVKASELEKEASVKRQERLSVEWQKVGVNEAKEMSEEWEIFKEVVLTCVREKCSIQRAGGR